jgi:tetratricopeptide (TPR) repeat protein
LAAATADSWSAEPWEILADLRSRRWLATPDQPHLAAFFTSQNGLLERNRHASQVQRRCGDRLLEMYAASQLAELGTAAVQAYTRAVEYHPNSAMLRAQLAWACHATGNEDEARRQADEALRLDALMPHAELKLANQRVVADYAIDSPPGQGPGRPNSNAEQLMLRLRKVKDR